MPNTQTKPTQKRNRTRSLKPDTSPRAISARRRKMESCLRSGLSAKKTATKIGITARSVYQFARDNNLPTNPEIGPNTPQERQICQNLIAAGIAQDRARAINAVAKLRGYAPAAIDAIARRVEKRPLKGATV